MNLKTIFPGFEPALVELIEKEAIQKTFSAGDIIMRSGQFIKSTVLVTEGSIKIYRENEDGAEFFMYYLAPGQACAVSMICAIQSQASEVMAIAEEATKVLMIPIQLMDTLMNNYKSWYQFVIQTYRSRFDEMLSVVDHVAFHNLDERLEFYLKRSAKQSGKKILDISHQQIADDLNSSREVVSRLLKKMEQRKLVRLSRNMIEVI